MSTAPSSEASCPFLDLGERQVLGERTQAIITRHTLAVAVALAAAPVATARLQPQLLLAVARQDQLQFV
jgi:hypothetical protein